MGVLVRHRGHSLVSDTQYVVPTGKVFGTPHVILRCETCGQAIWDEALS